MTTLWQDNCLVDNPIGLIRASLVMSFLAACCLAFTFQVTLPVVVLFAWSVWCMRFSCVLFFVFFALRDLPSLTLLVVHLIATQVTLRSFLMERKRQKLGEGAGGLASQQLPADSEDGGNVRQPYESSSASEEDGGYRLPSDEEGGAGMKQFVRV